MSGTRARTATTVAVVALGGALGALARHGIALALPTAPAAVPVATLLTNVTGCLLIGVLTVLVTEVRPTHPLVRPFLGTGVLGGFTTFSSYAVETERLLAAGRTDAALLYLVGTPVLGLLAAVAGTALARRLAHTATSPAPGTDAHRPAPADPVVTAGTTPRPMVGVEAGTAPETGTAPPDDTAPGHRTEEHDG
ncbi:MAG TPA: fluoride efflux transporter CrcB [Pseudonocardiaceae bacterium]